MESFVTAGDLEGAAQGRMGVAEFCLRKAERSSTESYEANDVALMNAQAAGNVELQVRMDARLSTQLADFDALEESRAALEQAVQLALHNRMQYLAAYVLVERARHYLPATELMARMGLKERGAQSMRRAEGLLKEVPAAGLRGEMEKVRQMVARIVVRQEDAVLASGFSGQDAKKRR